MKKALIISLISVALSALLTWSLRGHLGAGGSVRTLTFRYPSAFFAKAAPHRYVVYYQTASAPTFSEERAVYRPAAVSATVAVELPADVTEIRLDLSYAGENAQLALDGLVAEAKLDGMALDPQPANSFWLDGGRNLTTYYPALPPRVQKTDAYLFGAVLALFSLALYAVFARLAASASGLVVWNRFLVLAVALLFVFPWWKLDQSASSARERRTLERFPAPGEMSVRGFGDFCRRVGDALKDRFTGRSQFIGLAAAVKSGIGDGYSEDKALCGRSEWLYFKETLSDFANLTTYSEAEKRTIGDWLDGFHRWCAAHGKKFVLLIGPDKCRVYPDNVTGYAKYRPDSESRTSDLVAFLASRYSYPVVYARESLVDTQRAHQSALYYRHDTHWTPEGAFVGGYLPLCSALGRAVASPESWSAEPAGRYEGRDLTEMTSRILPRDETLLRKPKFGARVPNIEEFDDDESHQQIIHFSYDRGDGKRIFLLRDSFLTAVLPYLEHDFSEGYAHWRSYLKPDDAPQVRQCDVVVLELAERNIPVLLNNAANIQAIPEGFDE